MYLASMSAWLWHSDLGSAGFFSGVGPTPGGRTALSASFAFFLVSFTTIFSFFGSLTSSFSAFSGFIFGSLACFCSVSYFFLLLVGVGVVLASFSSFLFRGLRRNFFLGVAVGLGTGANFGLS